MSPTKPFVKGAIITGVSLVFLSGCGEEDPTTVVSNFLTAVQEGDFEKAGSYVEGGVDSLADDQETPEDEELFLKMMESISENYEFQQPEEISVEESSAVVKAEITSIDFASVLSSTMAEVMPIAFANAFEEPTPETEKAMEELTFNTMIKYITAEDPVMATQDVEFNLEKDEDGNFKIIDDDSLTDAIFANASQFEDLLSEGEDAAAPAEEVQSEKTIDVLSTVAENQQKKVEPFNITLEELSFKKASNVSDEELSAISMYTDEIPNNSFTYFYIKFNAENTSDKDMTFNGINEVVLFSEGKQEKIDIYTDWKDFIDYDEAQDPDYYGAVSKEGEVGVVIKTDPAKVEKVRIVLSDSMETETYETITEEQIIEYEITN
ncbi:DUF4878 domain-containing protein [Indiicoccus explosivorum]|uniref:DUF4878 domain-containing protein n=1 Tax=Indiicoccus explosivorum TaxID=1917864 RepID=UPI0013903031|nr:DUF4878 domain-containing protein [Indiicoccus explosivorum]